MKGLFKETVARDSGYDARVLSNAVVAHGEDWGRQRKPVSEAVRFHFVGVAAPSVPRTQFVREECTAVRGFLAISRR